MDPGAQIENSVLWDGVRVGPGARVRDAILGAGVRVAGCVTGVRVRAAAAGDPRLTDLIRGLGWPLAQTSVSPMAPRGSNRVFQRLYCGRRSAIAITYSLDRPENALYVRNARLLRAAGVSVPRVLLDRPAQQACVLEDVGNRSLLDVVGSAPRGRVLELYRRVLRQVVVFHTRAAAAAARRRLPLCEPFRLPLYRWEHRLFAEQYLRGRLHLPLSRIRAVRAELETLARRLNREPPVLLHRDLQSSNILFRGGRPCLIDFQGMRFGPAVYDLASLLCDPYAGLAADVQSELLRFYAARRGLDAAALERVFWRGAVQRLTQAIGAYARLSALPGMEDYARHIPAGLRMLRRALEHVDNLPALRRIVADGVRLAEQEAPSCTHDPR